MCTQKPPYDYSEQLYNRYRDSFSLYITEKVKPTEPLESIMPFDVKCMIRAQSYMSRMHALPFSWCHGVLCFVQVLPALREHHDEYLLRELYKRWCNHKIMVRWLSRFFNYLDR